MKKSLLTAIVLIALVAPASGASVSLTYSYFTVGGTSLDEIERQLQRRGPRLSASGSRHPGATQLEFSTHLTYRQKGGFCSVVDARVALKASMILPRWTRPRGADRDTRLIWETLAADIKRHEHSHVVIARNHARDMEAALGQLTNFRGCEAARSAAQKTSERMLLEHDRAQAQFDRVEGINFEKRISGLLQRRLERIEK